jgi:uncharacterized DUF497 family protein
MQFTWDPVKARANLREHGVSFEEASTVFEDPLARIHDDPDHSVGEQREIIVGTSASSRLILVSFTEDLERDLVRIIGARQPDVDERHAYEENI